MRKRGIEHTHAYCVDNCLVKVADPVFLGFSAAKDVEIAKKVVQKRNATESVGLILLKDGKPGVVEHSEIDRETAESKKSPHSEKLEFRAAQIVNHYRPDLALQLPYRVARKKIPHVDTAKGTTVKPEKPNGIKLATRL